MNIPAAFFFSLNLFHMKHFFFKKVIFAGMRQIKCDGEKDEQVVIFYLGIYGILQKTNNILHI